MAISTIYSIGSTIASYGASLAANASPRAAICLTTAALAIGYFTYNRNQEESLFSPDHTSVTQLSDLLKAKESRTDGTNLYQKAEELTKLLEKGGIDERHVMHHLNQLKLDPQEMAQVVALAKSNFRNTPGSPFQLLNDIQRELFNTGPERRRAFQRPNSPKAVSLAEGPLPQPDRLYRQKLLGYMRGKLDISALDIREDNYPEALKQIKILDLELDRGHGLGEKLRFKHSTYALRQACVVASKGKLLTFEAYTKSINPRNYENPYSGISYGYASKEENYIPERVQLHGQLTMKYTADLSGLSQRFQNDEPTVYALRGNTAVGKSFTAQKDPSFLRGLNDKGEAQGALNPDTLKAELQKRDSAGVTSDQVHIEGSSLNHSLKMELNKKAHQTSIVLDERLGPFSSVKKVVDVAAQRGKKVVFKDIDAPLAVSSLRVLGRKKTDPCAPFHCLAQGYVDMRAHRQAVIDLALRSQHVTSYELHVMGPSGRTGLAARKVVSTATTSSGATLEIVDRELYTYALSGKEAAEREIEVLATRRVDQSLYGPYQGKGVKVPAIQRYEGLQVREAVEKHAKS